MRGFHHGAQADWDAIVIGSGLGGLTAGATLQAHGKRTLVLEQYDTAGGCSQVFRRKRKYEFDIGLHYVGDCGPGGIVSEVFKALALDHKIEWLEMDPDGFDRLVFPELTFNVPRGWDRYRERLYEAFPNEREGIRKCTGVIQRVGEEVFASMPYNTAAMIKRVPVHGRSLLRYGMRSLGSLFDECRLSPWARAVIAGESGLYGTAPSRTAIMIHGIVLEHFIGRGAYYPKGGGQVPAALLVNLIQTHGGAVRTGARVEKVLVRNGRVHGVKLADGETMSAPVVISAADIKKTFAELVGREHLPWRFRRRVDRFRMVDPIFAVYLGLDIDLGERLSNANLWWMPGHDLEAMYKEVHVGIPESPSAYVRSGSLRDPSNRFAAPPGHSTLEILGFVPSDYRHWHVTGDPSEGRGYSRDPGYREIKERVADRLIKTTARAFPELEDLEDHIDWREASTPITQERYTRSSNGTPYGLELSPQQMGPRRPYTTTPIRGLYVAGGSTVYCHGITGAIFSGVGAAGDALGMPDLLREVQHGRAGVFADASKITAGGPDWDPLMSCRRLSRKPRAEQLKRERERAVRAA
jgi:all-trans-retinol 13,14-reductase